jgi:hypothetical protein
MYTYSGIVITFSPISQPRRQM